MLRLSMLLPFIALGSISLGQTENAGRWSIGADMGAGPGYRTLSHTIPATGTTNAIIRSRNDREEPRMTLGGHVGAGYQLSRHIGLEAGIGYMQLGWRNRIHLGDLTFGDMIDPRRGFIYGSGHALPERFTFNQVFHYLDLHLGATLTLGQGRWRSVSALGVAPALLIAVRTRTRYEYSDGSHPVDSYKPVESYNAMNLFPYFSTGVAFHPGGHWEWRLQPAVQYGALRVIDAPITAHLISGTVNLGVRRLL